MPGQIGDTTKTLFLNGPEAHKLHLEFEVAAGATIAKGQLVTLDATGKVTPAVAGDLEYNILGVSMHDGVGDDGDLVTIATRGYSVIYAEAGAALDAGAVEGDNGPGTEYPQVVIPAADYASVVGWSLDVAVDIGDVVRVLLKD